METFEDSADVTTEVEVNEWHNVDHSEDVNGDTDVTAMDALLIINDMNESGTRTLQSQLVVAAFLDVNDDGFLSPGDVLQVINYLNDPEPTSEQQDTALVSIADEIDSAIADTSIVGDPTGSDDSNTRLGDDDGTADQGSGDDAADDTSDDQTDGSTDATPIRMEVRTGTQTLSPMVAVTAMPIRMAIRMPGAMAVPMTRRVLRLRQLSSRPTSRRR
jgi:hypothetical protein